MIERQGQGKSMVDIAQHLFDEGQGGFYDNNPSSFVAQKDIIDTLCNDLLDAYVKLDNSTGKTMRAATEPKIQVLKESIANPNTEADRYDNVIKLLTYVTKDILRLPIATRLTLFDISNIRDSLTSYGGNRIQPRHHNPFVQYEITMRHILLCITKLAEDLMNQSGKGKDTNIEKDTNKTKGLLGDNLNLN